MTTHHKKPADPTPHKPPPESSGHAEHNDVQETIDEQAADPADTAVEGSGDREGMGRATADRDDFHRKEKP